jgi:hypothetical protein
LGGNTTGPTGSTLESVRMPIQSLPSTALVIDGLALLSHFGVFFLLVGYLAQPSSR